MFAFLDLIIVNPISNLLFVIYNFVGDFGLAIIIFTVVVKFALYPVVKRQFKQTRLMRKIQPELAEIRKNCKGNRTMEQLQMMDLYKRHNIKPFGSILILIIQLPIFFSLFFSISSLVPMTNERLQERPVEQRAYHWVAELPRIAEIIEDQSQAETLEDYNFRPRLFGTIDLSQHAIQENMNISSVFIFLFALTAAFSQYLVARQQMPSRKSRRTLKQIMKDSAAGKEANQAEINEVVSGQMSKFMPIMMFVIMIGLVGALSFYYLLSNLVTLLQQKIMLARETDEMDHIADKKILKELKEAQEGQVVSDKKATKGAATPTKKSNPTKNKNVTRITASTKKRRKK